MKKLLWIASALLAALAVSGCNDLQEQFNGSQPQVIKFTASVGNYTATKVTDTSFERGDTVGLFVGSPINLNNVMMVYDGTKLVPETTIYWGEGQTGNTSFKAYYPFNPELKALTGYIPYTICFDQSDHKGYSHSDLMAAGTEAGPSDGTVHLAFNHLMSKLTVKLDNQSGDRILSVLFGNVKTGSMIDAANMTAGEAFMDEETDYIRPAHLTDATGGNYYSAIMPPQSSKVIVLVTLASGRTEVFWSDATMVSGKQYTGTVSVAEAALVGEVQFTLEIVPWEDGGTFRFIDPSTASEDRTGWRMVYYPVGMSRVMEPMEKVDNATFKYRFKNYREGDYFFLLSDNDNYIFGCNMSETQVIGQNDNLWPVVNGGYFCLEGYEGDLDVFFYPDQGLLEYSPVNPKWEKIGEGEFIQGINSYLYGTIPYVFKPVIYEDSNNPGVYMFEAQMTPDDGLSSTLIIDATDPEKVWLKKGGYYPGWNISDGNSFYLESAVPENRDTEYEDYGTLQNGIIRLGMLKQTGMYDSSVSYFRPSMFQLVLPGYKRDPVFGLTFSYQLEQLDGVTHFVANVGPYPDVEGLRYQLFSGRLSNTEIRAAAEEFKAGAGQNLEFTPGLPVELAIPVTKPGTYTFMVFADAPSLGKPDLYWQYYYQMVTIEAAGDGVPAASMTLSGAKPYDMFPEKAALVHVDFPNARSLMVRAISKAAAEEAGLTEDDYFSYAMSGENKSAAYSYISSNGQDYVVTDLEPNTEYLIIAAGLDGFAQPAWASTTVTTGSAPTAWEEVGTGTWFDDTFMAGDLYTSQVQILKASGTERYRAVQPYASFWENDYAALAEEEPTTYANSYIGYSTDFDFFFKEYEGKSYIYYAPYRMGRVEPDFMVDGTETGYLDFFHYDLSEQRPSLHAYVKWNVALREGVYNIAPYCRVKDTNYMYPYYDIWEVIILAMPGYSLEETPAPAPKAPANCVELREGDPVPAIVFGEHSVTPFRHHPINMGKAIVKTL